MPPPMSRRRRHAEGGRSLPQRRTAFDRAHQRKPPTQSQLGVSVQIHPCPPLSVSPGRPTASKEGRIEPQPYNLCRHDTRRRVRVRVSLRTAPQASEVHHLTRARQGRRLGNAPAVRPNPGGGGSSAAGTDTSVIPGDECGISAAVTQPTNATEFCRARDYQIVPTAASGAAPFQTSQGLTSLQEARRSISWLIFGPRGDPDWQRRSSAGASSRPGREARVCRRRAPTSPRRSLPACR